MLLCVVMQVGSPLMLAGTSSSSYRTDQDGHLDRRQFVIRVPGDLSNSSRGLARFFRDEPLPMRGGAVQPHSAMGNVSHTGFSAVAIESVATSALQSRHMAV
jgi:hypothetical protein